MLPYLKESTSTIINFAFDTGINGDGNQASYVLLLRKNVWSYRIQCG